MTLTRQVNNMYTVIKAVFSNPNYYDCRDISNIKRVDKYISSLVTHDSFIEKVLDKMCKNHTLPIKSSMIMDSYFNYVKLEKALKENHLVFQGLTPIDVIDMNKFKNTLIIFSILFKKSNMQTYIYLYVSDFIKEFYNKQNTSICKSGFFEYDYLKIIKILFTNSDEKYQVTDLLDLYKFIIWINDEAYIEPMKAESIDDFKRMLRLLFGIFQNIQIKSWIVYILKYFLNTSLHLGPENIPDVLRNFIIEKCTIFITELDDVEIVNVSKAILKLFI